LKTWIFRIAHNQAVSWLRRMRVRDDLRERDEKGIEAGSSDDPEFSFHQTMEYSRLMSALDCLSPKHRAVIELAFANDLSYAEIAEIVSCPIGTVKSRMSYAMRALSEKMENE